MADIASGSSPRRNPYTAWTALPYPLSSVVVPSAGVMPWSLNDADFRALWDPDTDSPSDVQLNLLAWLAHHSTCTEESKRRLEAAPHMLFAHRQNRQRCILLVQSAASKRMSIRSAHKYSIMTLGVDAGGKRVLLDSQRLVCCLTKGPRPPGTVAKHAEVCPLKACINPAHLDWDTQRANVQEGYRARATHEDAQLGAVAVLVLGGLLPGRRRVALRSLATEWRPARPP